MLDSVDHPDQFLDTKEFIERCRCEVMTTGFLYWITHLLKGLDDYLEYHETPQWEMYQLALSTKDCQAKMKRRAIFNGIVKLSCFNYRAINEYRELWSPLHEPFELFSLRSTSITVWLNLSDLPPSREELATLIHRKLIHYGATL
jgi:hypothetical protein